VHRAGPKFVNDQAATFTMVHCEPTKDAAYATAAASFVWYVRRGAALIGSGPVNPFKIPHEKVMQSIELLGKEVLPAFD
jgi:hypothetical protein